MSAHDPALIEKAAIALCGLSPIEDDAGDLARQVWNEACDDATLVLDAVADQIRAQERERIAQAIEAAMRGDEFEENAAAAAGEGEWSWFRWEAARVAREVAE